MLQALTKRNNQSRGTALLLTYLRVLLSTRRASGNEEELEGALRYLKALGEIDRRTKTMNKHLKDVVSDDEGDKAESVGAEKKGKKGTKK